MKALIIVIFFTMISISAGAINYYVSLTGNDGYTGTSAETAWRTITYAAIQAKAGDIINIQGGNYGHEHVVVFNSGTSSAPIIFQGYNGNPVLDGGDHLGHGIEVIGKEYITLKNIRVNRYAYGIWVINNSHYATIDGCVADSCTDISDVPGTPQEHGSEGYGITVNDSDHSKILNCSATDDGGIGIILVRSHFCLIQNCIVKSKQDPRNSNFDKWYITDYYFVLSWCNNTLVRDCYVEDIPASYKGNHGFIVKDNPKSQGSETHSHDNMFINCTAKKFEEALCLSLGAYNNTFDSCTVDNTGKNSDFNFCIELRDGAHDNIFRNIKCIADVGSVGLFDRTGEGSGLEVQTNNIFTNCLFQGGDICITLQNAVNTKFRNCNMVNSTYLFRFQGANTTNADNNRAQTLKNCIISGVSAAYDNRSLASSGWTANQYNDMADISATYSDFFNGFALIYGIGNFSSNPIFASPIDFHLKSQYGRWDGSAWVNDDVTSSCINTGDPSDSYSNEPSPNGKRINIGVYGNTSEASKSEETSSIEHWQYQNLIKVYPNPVSGDLTIEIEGNNEEQKFEILNIVGLIIFKGNFVERTSVQTSNFVPGVYFVKIYNGKTSGIKKVIKI